MQGSDVRDTRIAAYTSWVGVLADLDDAPEVVGKPTLFAADAQLMGDCAQCDAAVVLAQAGAVIGSCSLCRPRHIMLCHLPGHLPPQVCNGALQVPEHGRAAPLLQASDDNQGYHLAGQLTKENQYAFSMGAMLDLACFLLGIQPLSRVSIVSPSTKGFQAY